ncbi:MAG: hypothetical protein ACOYNC_18500 [Bacteroidales bacterium]
MDFTLPAFHALLKAFLNEGFSFTPLSGIIRAVEKGGFPNQVMITIHPQRWTSNILLWSKELITQNLKNQIKRFMVK